MKKSIQIVFYILCVNFSYTQNEGLDVKLDSIDLNKIECSGVNELEFANDTYNVCTAEFGAFKIHKTHPYDTIPSTNNFLKGFVIEFDTSLVYFETEYINNKTTIVRIHKFENKSQIKFSLHLYDGKIIAFSLYEFTDNSLFEQFCFLDSRSFNSHTNTSILDKDIIEFNKTDF